MKTIVPSRLSLAVPLVLMLAACAATPPEPAVKVALPASYAQAQSGWTPAQPLAAAPRGAWWSVFNDPVLAGLEAQVAQHNQSLAAQLAAYEQAQAAVSQAQAAYYPTLTAGAAATRAKTAGTGAVGLEAASRGAVSVVLVDSDRAAASALRHNTEVVGRPGAPIQRSRVIGWSITPITGWCRKVRATRVPKIGRPVTKLLVPSIGSRIHCQSAAGRRWPYSSPKMPCSG